MKIKSLTLGAAFAVAGLTLIPASAGAAEPTCSSTLDIANHGQHILGDYVSGIGHDMDWPPTGAIGEAVAENGGALVPGAAGAHGHFLAGFQPGASFCLEQAQSPTSPPGTSD